MAQKKRAKGKPHRQLPPGMTYADVMAMKKAQVEAYREAAKDETVQYRADVHVQKIMWLMVVSVADAYGFGPKRMEPFFKTLQENSDEFSAMVKEDGEDYALEKLRKKAEAVTGAKIEYVYEQEMKEVRRMMEQTQGGIGP